VQEFYRPEKMSFSRKINESMLVVCKIESSTNYCIIITNIAKQRTSLVGARTPDLKSLCDIDLYRFTCIKYQPSVALGRNFSCSGL